MSSQDFYQFIQKQSGSDDPKYTPYLNHATNYITNIILLGNSVILCLITIIQSKKGKFPSHGMLGKLVSENKALFAEIFEEELINKLLEFNKALNLVKHSVIGMYPQSANDLYTILFFDLKQRQVVTIPIKNQQANISLAQKILAKLNRFL